MDPGLEMLEKLTGKKVVGVVPYLPLDLDDEDSLTDRFQRPARRGLVDIAVIRLPRISNFTDFNPLACMEQVSLRYVDSVANLGQPHVIMLPGTKNTMEDLKWLRESGLEAAICRHASRGRGRHGHLRRLPNAGEVPVRPRGEWKPAARCGAWACWMRRPSSRGEDQNAGPGPGLGGPGPLCPSGGDHICRI